MSVDAYNEDLQYGHAAIELGFINAEEAHVCLQLKQQYGNQYSLEQVMLQRGSLRPDQASAIRQHLINTRHPSNFGAPPTPQPPINNSSSSSYVQPVPQNATGSGFGSSRPLSSTSHGGLQNSYETTSVDPNAPVELPSEGDIFGKFKILSVLGKGGMGIVYKALHTELNREVALKMLVSGMATNITQLKRFYTEARSAARLAHRCIVPIHDVGEINNLHYFTMDFIEGRDLSDEIKARRIPEKEALTIIKDLAEALHYAHENEIIHRDLKPANILIDEHGTVRITDFGIAKDFSEGEGDTLSGEVLGTPAYMSPEQADGSPRDIDGRADLFSLGAILYEMLFREQAFKGATQYAIVTQVLTHTPVPPAIERAKISPFAEAVCFKCLQKDRENRYANGYELSRDIDRVLKGKKPLAPVLENRGQVLDPMRLAIVAGVSLSLAIIIGFSVWYSGEAKIDRLKAEGDGLVAKAKGIIKKQRKAAIEAEETARRKVQNAREYYLKNDPKRGQKAAAEARALTPENPEVLADTAEFAIKYDRNAELGLELLGQAEQSLEYQLAALEASNLERVRGIQKKIWQQRVLAHWQKRNFLETRQSVVKLLENFPGEENSTLVIKIRGLLAFNDENWQKCLECFGQITEISSDSGAPPEIIGRLAYSYFKTSQLKEAETQANSATNAETSEPFSNFVLAQLRYKQARESKQSAEKQYRKLKNVARKGGNRRNLLRMIKLVEDLLATGEDQRALSQKHFAYAVSKRVEISSREMAALETDLKSLGNDLSRIKRELHDRYKVRQTNGGTQQPPSVTGNMPPAMTQRHAILSKPPAIPRPTKQVTKEQHQKMHGLMKQCLQSLTKNDLKTAEKLYNEASKIGFSCPESLGQIGDYYLFTKQYKKALFCYELLIKKSGNKVSLLHFLKACMALEPLKDFDRLTQYVYIVQYNLTQVPPNSSMGAYITKVFVPLRKRVLTEAIARSKAAAKAKQAQNFRVWMSRARAILQLLSRDQSARAYYTSTMVDALFIEARFAISVNATNQYQVVKRNLEWIKKADPAKSAEVDKLLKQMN